MPKNSSTGTSTEATASRRTLLRTAAHAAWAVPAIQIACAAPAFASTPGVVALSTRDALTLTSATYASQGVNIILSATASYPGTQTPQNLVFHFDLPAAPGSQTETTLKTDPGADWETVIAPGGLIISVVRKTPILTSPVSVSLKVHVKPQRPGAINVVATASNMSQASEVATSS